MSQTSDKPEVQIGWYSREDYDAVRQIERDLPDTFEEWLFSARLVEEHYRASGHRVIRYRVSAADLIAHLRRRTYH